MAKAVDKRLHEALKPVKKRILLRHFMKYIALGAILALIQATIWLCASFLIPIPYMWEKVAVCGLGITLISVAVGAFHRPSLKSVAREADRLGLQERAITAYERMGLEDAFSVLQREDAIRTLKELDARMISVVPPKKWLLSVAGLALLVILGSLLPNPQSQIAARQTRVQKEIEKQVERLQNEVEENLAAQDELTDEEKRELRKLVNQLARRLRQTGDYKEAIKEVSKAEQQLTQLVNGFRQYRMGLVGETLEKHLLTADLGRATKAMDAEWIRQAIENLKERIKQGNMDSETMQSLEVALNSAAAALPDGSLKSQLEKAAGAVASAVVGQSGDIAKELDSLKEMLAYMAEGGLANPADIQYMLQNMKHSIAAAAGQDIHLAQNSRDASHGMGSHSNGKTNGELNREENGQNSAGQPAKDQGLSGENGDGGSSGRDGQGSGSGQGDGEAGGAGNAPGGSSSPGNSIGTGQGSSGVGAGPGAGTGHTNQDAGHQGGSIPSHHNIKGRGNPDSYGDYERIYDPTRLGDGGQTGHVTGKPSGQGPSQQVEAGPGLGSFDGFIPYNEVFGSYSRQAMQNLERMNIPAEMRELIKEYFKAIE